MIKNWEVEVGSSAVISEALAPPRTGSTADLNVIASRALSPAGAVMSVLVNGRVARTTVVAPAAVRA